MYMVGSRDVGGDRDCALEVHVWLIWWVGSEHILHLHCEAQKVWLVTWVTQLSLCQLPACDAHRTGDVKVNCASIFPCILCTGTSNEVLMPWNPPIIYTQGLAMLLKTEFELWVLMKQIWGTYLGSHWPLFNLAIPVLPCGTPAQKEQQNCVRILLEGQKGNLSVWAVPASCKCRQDPWAGDTHNLMWLHRERAPLTRIGRHSLQSRFRSHSALKTCHFKIKISDGECMF